MKTCQTALIILAFFAGISCKEKVILKREKASFIPAIVKNIRFDKGLGTELIQARQNGILSDYQFSIWMDVYGKRIRINDAITLDFRGAIHLPGRGLEEISMEESNAYHSSQWAFYDNHAYNGDWEMGLWQLAE